jgi:hypothetical protein
MFVIQYEGVDGSSKMQDFDSNSRTKLVQHLAGFGRPITAVYEQSTPITSWARIALRSHHGLSKDAREFATSQVLNTQTFRR